MMSFRRFVPMVRWHHERKDAETPRLLRSDPRHELLPVIVLTAQRGGAMRRDAIMAGADDFIGEWDAAMVDQFTTMLGQNPPTITQPFPSLESL
jgi:CheY-like chemotaxis protein